MKKNFSLFVLILLIDMPLYADEQDEMTPGIARAQFTTVVVDREPVDDITELPNNITKIHFFSDQRGMKDQPLTHRWEYNGKVMAEIKFEIGGPRWRVKSSKNLLPNQLGKWKVSIVDWAGEVIAEKTFTYIEAK
jgi:hypothetical protein